MAREDYRQILNQVLQEHDLPKIKEQNEKAEVSGLGNGVQSVQTSQQETIIRAD